MSIDMLCYDHEDETSAVPDVPELVRYGKVDGVLMMKSDGEYVLHSQAAEIIRSMIPRVNNCGRYIAERNDGTLMYLNHGNTWQGCDNFIAAKDKEIERLKNLIDGDDCPDPDKIDALFSRAEAAEAKLAQYEAQEPVAWRHPEAGWTDVSKAEVAVHCKHGTQPQPLYASPAPAEDLKAENIERELDGYIQHFREQTRIAPVHVTKALSELKIRLLSTLNVETSHDKG